MSWFRLVATVFASRSLLSRSLCEVTRMVGRPTWPGPPSTAEIRLAMISAA